MSCVTTFLVLALSTSVRTHIDHPRPAMRSANHLAAMARPSVMVSQLRLRGGAKKTGSVKAPAAAGAATERGAGTKVRKKKGGLFQLTAEHAAPELDEEIESIISNQDMLDVEGGGVKLGWGDGPARQIVEKPNPLPRPNTAAIFRAMSGSAIHYYDWPSDNNSHYYSTDEDRTWR